MMKRIDWVVQDILHFDQNWNRMHLWQFCSRIFDTASQMSNCSTRIKLHIVRFRLNFQ